MRKRNKSILCVALTLFMVFSLAACGPKGEKEADNAEPAKEAKEGKDNSETVKIAVQEGRTMLKEIVDKYVEETGKEVEYIEIAKGDDYYSKVTLMLSSKDTATDIIFEDGFMVKSDAAAGLLAPMDDYLAKWADWDSYNPAVVEAGTGMDGKQYAIPISTDEQVIWYNTDVFEAAKLDPDWQPKTWQDIIDTAKKLKEANSDDPGFLPMNQFVSTSNVEQVSMRTFQLFYAATGGKLYDYDTDQWIVDKANIKKVLDYVDQVWNVEELSSLDLAASNDPESTFTSEMFPNGDIGLYFTGSWAFGDGVGGSNADAWKEILKDGKVKYAFVPTYDGKGYVTTSGGWTFAMAANGSNLDGGWDLLKYICQEENMTYWAIESGNLPARADSFESDAWKSQEYSGLMEKFEEGLEFTVFRPTVDGYASVTELYAQLIENVAFGVLGIDDAVDHFEGDMKAAMGADLVKVIE